ncbi:MAG: 50S ribosomal protein L23 [Candidatus Omnitrophota bacterium]|nr:50S ribosomal protein L23 [Candidatus Omnitrophota bacterium]
MKNSHDIVKGLLRTEKGADMMPFNKYLFWVDTKANKVEIRDAVENIYKVKVDKVNTINVKGKPKRVRYTVGMTSGWKKAVVTLKKGNKIDVV